MEGRGVGRVILVTIVTIEGALYPLVTLAPGVDVEVDIDVEIHPRLLVLMVTLVMIGMVILRGPCRGRRVRGLMTGMMMMVVTMRIQRRRMGQG